MDEYALYTAMEYVIFGSYLVFVFLSVQIWFLWKDMDKKDATFEHLVTDGTFKKSFFYVSALSLFFFMHEFLEGMGMQNIMLYFEMLEMLGFICLVLFAYEWYKILKICPCEKPHSESSDYMYKSIKKSNSD